MSEAIVHCRRCGRSKFVEWKDLLAFAMKYDDDEWTCDGCKSNESPMRDRRAPMTAPVRVRGRAKP